MWQRREMQMQHKYNAIRAINAALLPAFLCFYCIVLHGERDAFCIWGDASRRAQGRRRIKCNRGVIRWKRRMQLPFGSWAARGDVRSTEQRQGRWKHLRSEPLWPWEEKSHFWASLFSWKRSSAAEIEDQFTHPHSTGRLFQERLICKVVRVFLVWYSC